MKQFIIFQVLLFLIAPLYADIVNIGELSREDTGQAVLIDIVSANPEVSALARRAFSTHGAYKVVSSEKSTFTFRFDQKSPTEVTLSIESGNPLQTQFTQTIKAKSLTEATLKASDVAVNKTLGKPGYFAGQIAFVGERNGSKEIYTSDLFFKRVRQLTHDQVDVVFPKWSPDGKKIIYTSYYKTGFPDIFVIDLATNQRKTVAAYTGTNIGGVFSPDGKKIAMVLSSSGNPELYTTNTTGRSPKRLTKTRSLEASPCWSADGKKLYFSSDGLGAPQLYEINATGGEMKRIPTNISRYCDEPTVNPVDPNLLAFTAAVAKKFQITLYDFDEKKSRFITEGADDHMEPFWLNDGRHLLMTRRDGAVHELRILDTETGKSTRLHSADFGNASMGSFIYR